MGGFPMMKRENGRVLIDISEDDFYGLVFVLGFAGGAAVEQKNGVVTLRRTLELANAINEGNPNWTPYDTSAMSSEPGPDEAETPAEAKQK
jgi:hypothetical protein